MIITVKNIKKRTFDINEKKSSPENYASEKISERTKDVTENTVISAENIIKKGIKNRKQTAEKTKYIAQQSVKLIKSVVAGIKVLGKSAISGIKALIAAGPVVIIIIVICLLAAVGGTCFGIFLSNDKTTGTETTMTEAISEITADYYNSLIQSNYDYDEIEINGDTSINWKDVLTVYAVKYTNESDGFDVATLNSIKIKKLKEISEEMNYCNKTVTYKTVPVIKVVTDSSGKQSVTTEYESKKVLKITPVHISAVRQSKLYNFSSEAIKQVNELLSDDYILLWNDLIGNTVEITVTDGTVTGTNIFSWPLSVKGSITSRFGTRKDPFTGEIKTHGGTDIAVSSGTSIFASADGVVVNAEYHSSYGFYVKIRHNNTFSTLYAHCSTLFVSAGQTVKKGQKIAEVGSTGNSTGPHLHYEIIQNGVRVDAMKYFK